MVRKRKNRDELGGARSHLSQAEKHAEQNRVLDELRSKLASSPSAAFPEHPFDPKLDMPVIEPGLIRLQIYESKTMIMLTLLDFDMRNSSPRLTTLLEKLGGMEEYHKKKEPTGIQDVGELITFPEPSHDSEIPAEDNKEIQDPNHPLYQVIAEPLCTPGILYANHLYNRIFLPEYNAKYGAGISVEITLAQFLDTIKLWAEYSISGKLVHEVKKAAVWYHLRVGEWLQATDPFMMTVRAIDPLPLSAEVNMNIIALLFHHENRNKKLIHSDSEQPDYLVLSADLLDEGSILCKELHRPDGYIPVLAPTGSELYNPKSPFHGERESLKSPAVYIFDFIHSMKDVLPTYAKLRRMTQQHLWIAVEDPLFYQMEYDCYTYDDDPSGMEDRRHKLSEGMPLYIYNAVLVAQALGINTDKLIDMHEYAKQQAKLNAALRQDEVESETDEEASNEVPNETEQEALDQVSNETGYEAASVTNDEDSSDSEEASVSSDREPLETNFDQALKADGEDISEEIDAEPLETADDEVLEALFEEAEEDATNRNCGEDSDAEFHRDLAAFDAAQANANATDENDIGASDSEFYRDMEAAFDEAKANAEAEEDQTDADSSSDEEKNENVQADETEEPEDEEDEDSVAAEESSEFESGEEVDQNPVTAVEASYASSSESEEE